jgi:WD40 repeat protein/predicted Ser/Thr protein kinase
MPHQLNLDQRRRVELLFDQLYPIAPAERGARLDSECSDDPNIRRELEELLDAADRSSSAWGTSVWADAGLVQQSRLALLDAIALEPGTPIGDYRIVRALPDGRGGMGVVYEADQENPRRRVALKLVRPGLLSPAILRRFEFEAAILGRLEHPGIARIYQAGLTTTRLGMHPFFAMEFIDGRPLDDYVRVAKPDLKSRLRLLIGICQAVHYAHSRGVIHRDLKPANIMVCNDGQTKVLDFGVARATDGDVPTATLHTQAGEVIGTLAYMSPEQACGKVHELDAAADVYSLGVIAYELLCGKRPYETKNLPMHEAVRVICESVPTPLGRIDRTLRGDLETITGKALRKERQDRYATAGELAADIQHYLNCEPIVAHPPSRLYVLRKFVRRNKLLVGAAAAVFIALLLGIIGTTAGILHANQQRALAEQRGTELRHSLYLAEMNLLSDAASSDTGVARITETLWAWAVGRPDMRGWEWYYLKNLCRTDLLTMRGHVDGVRGLAWSNDGRRLASSGVDGVVRIWSAADGRELLAFDGTIRNINALAWSPDDTRIATTGNGGQVKVWDASSGRLVARWNPGHELARALAWSPDGTLIASGGTNRKIFIADARTGARIHELSGHEAEITCVAWSPDGALLASATQNAENAGGVRIWDTSSGTQILSLTAAGSQLDWSPDGKMIASGSSNWAVRVFNVADGKMVFDQSHGGQVRSVAWSPDGKQIASAGGFDFLVKVWNFNPKSLAFTYRGHLGPVNRVRWSAQGGLASASDDGTVRIWTRSATAIPSSASQMGIPLRGHERSVKPQGNNWVEGIGWRRDQGLLATSDRNGLIKIWDTRTRQEVRSINASDSIINDVAFSPDGTRLASAGLDKLVKIYDMETGAEQFVLKGHTQEVRAVAWSPDGKLLVSAAQDLSVRVWNPSTGQEIRVLSKHTSGVRGVAFSPDGSRLASASADRTVRIWDPKTWQEIKTLSGHSSNLEKVAWSPDGHRIASASWDQTVRIWDVDSGQQLTVLRGHTNSVFGVAWSPDGSRIASASLDRTIKLWDVHTGRMAITITGTDVLDLHTVQWSPDGMFLAVGGRQGYLALLDASGGYAAEHSPGLLPTLDQQLASDPSDPGPLQQRARTYAQMGRWPDAAADILEIFKREPQSQVFVAGTWIVGPFPADLSGSFEPERAADHLAAVRAAAGASSDSPHELLWQPIDCDINGYFDPRESFPGARPMSVYLMMRAYAHGGQAAALRMRSEEGMRIWVNGQPAFGGAAGARIPRAGPAPQALVPPLPQDVPTTLQNGWNTIIARIVVRQSGGAALPQLSIQPTSARP